MRTVAKAVETPMNQKPTMLIKRETLEYGRSITRNLLHPYEFWSIVKSRIVLVIHNIFVELTAYFLDKEDHDSRQQERKNYYDSGYN